MAISVADLGVRVLQRLAVISAVETPSAEDQDKAEQKVNDAHLMLAQIRATRWTLQGTPAYAVPGLVECAASLLAPEYGIVGEHAPQWMTGEMMLRRLKAIPLAREPEYERPDYS